MFFLFLITPSGAQGRMRVSLNIFNFKTKPAPTPTLFPPYLWCSTEASSSYMDSNDMIRLSGIRWCYYDHDWVESTRKLKNKINGAWDYYILYIYIMHIKCEGDVLLKHTLIRHKMEGGERSFLSFVKNFLLCSQMNQREHYFYFVAFLTLFWLHSTLWNLYLAGHLSFFYFHVRF